MKNSTLYSIGHGNKRISIFIQELHSFGIEYLLDIRTKPFSRWHPQFNRSSLQSELEKCGITYVFLGDALGGLPDDSACYDSDGKIRYDVLKEKDFFKQGLQRLITACEKEIRIAIMCSETNPGACHRSKLIGEELRKCNIPLHHIISQNKQKSQETVMSELTKGNGIVDLFGRRTSFTSKKLR
ncbi:MAG: DUF488 domain-containing protein [Prevotellaceae bacterium]|nr:DUF488 domain-containing protein [Prevotellaceae bacterium]